LDTSRPSLRTNWTRPLAQVMVSVVSAIYARAGNRRVCAAACAFLHAVVRRQVSNFTFPPPPVRLLVQDVTCGFAPTRLSSDYLITQINEWSSVLRGRIGGRDHPVHRRAAARGGAECPCRLNLATLQFEPDLSSLTSSNTRKATHIRKATHSDSSAALASACRQGTCGRSQRG
jgi:hypothetical protein